MKHSLMLVATMAVLSGPAFAQDSAPKASAAPAESKESMIEKFRMDLQSTRADIIAKNISLSADQAAKFWPMFEKYQKEQNVIMDEQLKGIQEYADNYQNLDDARALALINTQLKRDLAMAELRMKWLTEFQKILPVKLAAKVIQMDRRLSQVLQVELSSRIPLIR